MKVEIFCATVAIRACTVEEQALRVGQQYRRILMQKRQWKPQVRHCFLESQFRVNIVLVLLGRRSTSTGYIMSQ